MILVIFLFVFLALFLAAYYDLKTGEIPLNVTMPLILIGFLMSLFPWNFANIIIGLVFIIIGLVAYEKKLFGGGDIKLILGVILLNPTADLIFIIYWLLISSIIALVAIGFKTAVLKKPITQEIRFAPYLFIAYLIMIIGYIYFFMW